MQKPFISIIIPSYNKVRFINQTLESIFDQNYQNLEVVINDGGSDDGTLEIIKKFAKKYPKVIQLESKKDKGQLDAINKGFGKAGGDIVTFINADDVYLPGAFNTISKLYSSNPDSLWFAGKGIVIDSKGKEIAKFVTWYKNLFLSFNQKSLILILNYLMQPSVFLTRKAWKESGPFTGTSDFVTEYEMWLKLSKIDMPTITNKNLSAFRIDDDNITQRMTQKLLKADEIIIQKYTKNFFILTLHKFYNLARVAIGKVV